MSTRPRHLPLQRAADLDVAALPDEDLLDLGNRWFARGRYVEARELADPLAARTPTNREAHLLAARSHALSDGSVGAVDQHYRAAEATAPLLLDDYLTWLGFLARSGIFAPARDVVAKMVVAFPEDLRARSAAAEAYGLVGDLPAAWWWALRSLEEIAATGPGPESEQAMSVLAALPSVEHPVLEPSELRTLTRCAGEVATFHEGFRLRAASVLEAVGARRDALDLLRDHDFDDASLQAGANLVCARAVSEQQDDEQTVAYYDRTVPAFRDRLPYLAALFEVGRLDDARRQWRAYHEDVERWSRRLDAQRAAGEVVQAEDQRTLLSCRILEHIFDVALSDAEQNHGQSWKAARDLVGVAHEFGLEELDPALQHTVAVLELKLAVTPEQRQNALERLDTIDASHEHRFTTEYVQSLLWAGSVSLAADRWTPPAEREAASAQLRARAQAAARAAHSRDSHPSEESQLHRAQLALVAGDVLTAASLLSAAEDADGGTGSDWRDASPTRRHQVETVRAQIHLSCVTEESNAKALELCTETMKAWRQDLTSRLVFAQALRASGDLDRAAEEAIACRIVAPANVIAQVEAAEYQFQQALTTKPGKASKPATGQAHEPEKPGGEQTAKEYTDNVHQLVEAVAGYRRAVELHVGLTEWLGGADIEECDIGSELLNDATLTEVCRQGLHAAVLAAEGLSRLKLPQSQSLKESARFLADHLRTAQGSGEEATRLMVLFRAHRRARWRSIIVRGVYGLAGVATLVLALLLDQPTEIRLVLAAAGLALALVQVLPEVKLAGVELKRESAEEQDFRRSERLRSAPALRLDRLPLKSAPALAPVTPRRRSEDEGNSDADEDRRPFRTVPDAEGAVPEQRKDDRKEASVLLSRPTLADLTPIV